MAKWRMMERSIESRLMIKHRTLLMKQRSNGRFRRDRSINISRLIDLKKKIDEFENKEIK